MPTLEELRRKPHHSYSSVNTFLSCPLQYAMRYVYKLEPERVGVALPFGSAFHGALTWLAENRRKGDYSNAKELADVFSEHWKVESDEEGELLTLEDGEWDNLNELGRKMVEAFYEGWTEDVIVDVSAAFSVPVIDGDGEPVSDKPLIGEIDLIVEDPQGEITLVDWKTAARKWADGKADSHLQATCFCMAHRWLSGVISPFRFDVVTKTKQPKYEAIRTIRVEDDFHRLAELIGVMERAVASDVFFPVSGSFMCKDCSHASACREWHRGRTRTLSLAA
jgi:RecB family exonuclease